MNALLTARAVRAAAPALLALWLLAPGCGPAMSFGDAGDAGLDARDTGPAHPPMPDVLALGRVCQRTAECDDGIDCTDDVCGSDNRCANIPNAGRCVGGSYCDGMPVCDARRGCVRGMPVNCDDGDTCTEDRCVEDTRSCTHAPLDRDGDGDPDIHCHARVCDDGGVMGPTGGACWRGGDCNDRDPRISSHLPEVCNDGLDNNCNGQIDEMPCVSAAYERCDSPPIDVSAGGLFTLDVLAARATYAFACLAGSAHQVVAHFQLDHPQDVFIDGATRAGVVTLALQGANCGSSTPSDTLACTAGLPARVRFHSLPAGSYHVIVATATPEPVDLTVRFAAATPQPTNSSCGTPTIVPAAGGTFTGDLIGARDNVSTRCGGTAPDVLYTFTLDAPQDVTLQLAGGRPSDYLTLSLLSACTRLPTTLRCDAGRSVQFTAHTLAAGTYFVAVESFDPVSFTLQVLFAPPTPPVHGDTCDDPIVLTDGAPTMVSGAGLENDYSLTCFASGPDAVFRFDLAQRRDVDVSARGMSGDFFAVALRGPACAVRPDRACSVAGTAARATALALDPGTYYAVVKTLRPTDYTVTLRTFAPVASTAVTGNDTCMTAYAIPPGRGLFRGDSTGRRSGYRSPCAGSTPGGDAVFSLHLAAQQRVSLVTDTGYFHAVWISRQDACPGTPPMSPGAVTCTLGTHSTLDAVLDAGDYYIFIAGFQMTDAGPYSLLVSLDAP